MFALRRLPRSFVIRKFHASSLLAAKKIQDFKLADIGEGITECEIIKWSVKPSSPVAAFDLLCEVQSDKASVEITSPFDGVVKELLVKEGEIAKVGEGLCLIEVEEEGTKAADAEQAESNPTPLHSEKPDIETSTSNEPPKLLHPLDPKGVSSIKTSKTGHDGVEVLATPSVRHFAKQKGVDLALLAPGSGRGGRIEKKDIEAFLERSASSAQHETTSTSDVAPVGEVTIELGRTRLAMWKAMTKSLEIPHFGYSTYLDVTPSQAMLAALDANIPFKFLPKEATLLSRSQMTSQNAIYGNNYHPSVPHSDPLTQYTKLTLLPFLLKALSKAMMEWPIFRSSISSSDPKPTVSIRPQADICIALSTPSGLYSPTVQKVDGMSVYEIMGELRRLSNLGRRTPNHGLGPKELPKNGGTITVSNVGAIGKGEFASPVLVPGGGVAIVALGRAHWVNELDEDVLGMDAMKDESEAVVGRRKLRMGVSWSADHRVVEGAELAGFMECWRSWVENPVRLIGEGR